MVLLAACLLALTRSAGACTGDCDGHGSVTAAELVCGVNMALGVAALDRCPDMDATHDGRVAVDDLVEAMGNVLDGCREVVATDTPSLSATNAPETPGAPTRSPTPTATGGADAACGNNVVEAPETCDDGSVCVFGSNVPETPQDCTDTTQCAAGETCVPKYPPEGIAPSGGTCAVLCRHDADCGDLGQCMPAGGDGCAANCTSESDIVEDIGELTWAHVQFQSLFMELAPRGQQTFTIGKARSDAVRQIDGRTIFSPYEVPIAVKARSFQMGPITIPNLACACLRGYEAPRYGPGNSAGGKFTCDAGGIDGVDAFLLSDHMYGGPEQCTDFHDLGLQDGYVEPVRGKVDRQMGHEGSCNVANASSLSNHGPRGSAILRMTLSLAYQQFPSRPEACTPADTANPHPWFGPDGRACTDDDPDKGAALPVPLVTGHARGEIRNANNVPDRILGTGSGAACKKNLDCTAANPEERCFNEIGEKCGARDECTCRLPCGTLPCLAELTGRPIQQCDNPGDLLNGLCLASSFTKFGDAMGDMFVVLNMCSGTLE